MNLDQLGKSFEAHKAPVLATAGAAVVAFALYQRKKTAAPAGPAQGIATTGGVYSAGGQVAGASGAAAYDSTSSDVYGLIQPQLESLGGQITDLNTKLNGTPVSVAPVASTLLSPTKSGTYLQFGNGNVEELEADNSLYHLSLPEWAQLQAAGGTLTNAGMTAPPGGEFSYAANLQQRITKAAGSTPTPTTPKS